MTKFGRLLGSIFGELTLQIVKVRLFTSDIKGLWLRELQVDYTYGRYFGKRYKKDCRYNKAGMAYVDVLELQTKSKKEFRYQYRSFSCSMAFNLLSIWVLYLDLWFYYLLNEDFIIHMYFVRLNFSINISLPIT